MALISTCDERGDFSVIQEDYQEPNKAQTNEGTIRPPSCEILLHGQVSQKADFGIVSIMIIPECTYMHIYMRYVDTSSHSRPQLQPVKLGLTH